MIFHAVKELGVYPLHKFVKVGDTIADVAEGHAARAWVVAVVRSRNEGGCSAQELTPMNPVAREARIFAAHEKLAACGPHNLINTVADLLPVIDAISEKIARGEMPSPAEFTSPITMGSDLGLLSAR